MSLQRLFATAILAWVCTAGPARAGWVVQNSGTSNDLHAVNFHHSTDARAWACGDNGTIVRTANGGETWESADTGTTAHLYGIVFHEDGGSVIAVGAKGTILRSTDLGVTWTQVPSPTTENLRDTSDFRYYAVGDHGTILKSFDQGLNWSVLDSGSNANLRSVIGLEPFPTAVGEGGTILRGDPQGVTWQPIASGTGATLNGVPLFPIRVLVGDAGTILRSPNFGGPWTPAPAITLRALRSIADANGAIYVAGAHGTILKSIDNGATWGQQAAPVREDLNGAFFYLFAHVGYMVGNHGTILKTTDGGGPILEPVGVEPEVGRQMPRHVTCSPNPFHGSTQLTYALTTAADVWLTVFDVRGHQVLRRFEGRRPAGLHVATWDAAPALATGTYVCRLQAGDAAEVLRTTLVR